MSIVEGGAWCVQSMIDLDFGSVAGSDRAMGADKPTVLGSGPVSQYNIASGAMVGDLSVVT